MIVPCKGLEAGLEENLRSALQQDYSRYSVVFVTCTEDDPAFPLIGRLAAEGKQESPDPTWVRAVAAQFSGIRAQKLDNQLRALDEGEADTAIYVFFDSDTRPHRRLVRELVRTLLNTNAGVSTGYCWLIPDGGLWSIVAAVRNNAGVSLAVVSQDVVHGA